MDIRHGPLSKILVEQNYTIRYFIRPYVRLNRTENPPHKNVQSPWTVFKPKPTPVRLKFINFTLLTVNPGASGKT